jgi:hypothetical protein
MRRVSVDSIPVGVKLARTIFSSDGGVLLEKGIELRGSYVEQLKKRGISEVYLEDDISKGITVSDVIKEETRNEAVVLVKKMMTGYNFSVSKMSKKLRNCQ